MGAQVERQQVENITHLSDVSYGVRPSRLRLLAPLRYLTIKNAEKSRYDIAYPVAFGVLTWGCYWLFTPDVQLFGDGGLLRFGRDLLIMAVPFLFGALAVVATGLPGDHFDERLKGVNLILDGRPLTLRRFVAYLLGYLSFLSMFTLVVIVLAGLVHTDVARWASAMPYVKFGIELAGTLFLSLLISALSITVLWSLYFLTDVVNNID